MNSPYHIITISAIVFLGYALTWLLSYLSILPKVFHRRFWNTILLIAFLLTAIIGLMLTLQVNLKFELQALDAYMVWHVDAGIALALISIFHIYWHWKYYVNLFKVTQTEKKEKETVQFDNKQKTTYSSKNIRLFGFLLGLNSIVIQTLFLREFIVMFTGNEITIGIILFFWMIFTGIGANFSGKKIMAIRYWETILILLLVLSALLIATMNNLRFKLFLPGEEINLLQVFWFSALFLFPICFLSGFLFPKLFYHYQLTMNENKINQIYSVETFGCVVGGLTITFVLGIYFRSLEIIGILFILNSLFFLFIRNFKNHSKITLLAGSILIFAVIYLFNFDKTIKQPLFLNQDLISYRPSPFGDIAKTQQYEQQNYFQNTELLFNNQDVIKTEELVHFPMLQLENPQTILLLGGDFPEILQEMEKYNVKHIDFIEPNPLIYKQWLDISALQNDKIKINLFKKDFRKFLKRTNLKYDAVILNLPTQEDLQSNRFYTDEFYKLLTTTMSDSGVLSFNLPPVHNYLNDEQVKLFSSIYHTAKRHFKNLEFVVSENTFLLASNIRIDLNMGDLVNEKELQNDFVNSYYVDSRSIAQHNEDIKQNINPHAEINFDFKPIIFKRAIKNWLEKTQVKIVYRILFIVLLAILTVSFFINKAPQSSLLLAGFSTSATEIILIYLFQIIFGNIFQYIGLIIAVFMLGITIGASNKFSTFLNFDKKNLRRIQITLMLIPLLLILCLKFLVSGAVLFIIVLVLAFFIPLLTGWLFNFTTHVSKTPNKKSAGYNYFIDLLGSAVGVVMVSVFILPQVGLYVTILVVSGINLIGFFKIHTR